MEENRPVAEGDESAPGEVKPRWARLLLSSKRGRADPFLTEGTEVHGENGVPLCGLRDLCERDFSSDPGGERGGNQEEMARPAVEPYPESREGGSRSVKRR